MWTKLKSGTIKKKYANLKIEENKVEQIEPFEYLGPLINSDPSQDGDMSNRVAKHLKYFTR